MQHYQSRFMQLVENTQIKGLNDGQGILASMLANVYSSEQQLLQLNQQLNVIIEEEVGDINNFILTKNIIGLMLALLVMVVTAWLAQSILNPIQKLSKTMIQASNENDLSLRLQVQSNDEIGQTSKAFNIMLEQFQTIISEINNSGQQISLTSKELSYITQKTHNGAQEQQLQTSQAVTAMKKMLNSVHRVSLNATEAARAGEQDRGFAVVADEVRTLAGVPRRQQKRFSR